VRFLKTGGAIQFRQRLVLNASNQHRLVYRHMPNGRQSGGKTFGLVVSPTSVFFWGYGHGNQQGFWGRRSKPTSCGLAQSEGQFRSIAVLQVVE
jgi:hypothetical protein